MASHPKSCKFSKSALLEPLHELLSLMEGRRRPTRHAWRHYHHDLLQQLSSAHTATASLVASLSWACRRSLRSPAPHQTASTTRTLSPNAVCWRRDPSQTWFSLCTSYRKSRENRASRSLSSLYWPGEDVWPHGQKGSVSALKEDRMSPKAPCLLPRKYEGHRVLWWVYLRPFPYQERRETGLFNLAPTFFGIPFSLLFSYAFGSSTDGVD